MCSSDLQYAPYQIDAAEVLEIWSAKAYISLNFPDERVTGQASAVDQLADMVSDLQQELSKLRKSKKDKLREAAARAGGTDGR